MSDTGKLLTFPRNGSETPGFKETLASDLARQGIDIADCPAAVLRLCEALVADREALEARVKDLDHALDRAQSLADHDPLIPVYNRRAFVRELSRQLSFCLRYDVAAALIYMDLDGFKQLNDQFGHSAGDEGLRKFGQVLIQQTRESDLVGRLGGDEFSVLLVNATRRDAEAKIAEICERTPRIRLAGQSTPIGLGVSCGTAIWKRGETAETLIARADEAMYATKLEARRRLNDIVG